MGFFGKAKDFIAGKKTVTKHPLPPPAPAPVVAPAPKVAAPVQPAWTPEPKVTALSLDVASPTSEVRLAQDITEGEAKKLEKGPMEWHYNEIIPPSDRAPGSGIGYIHPPYGDMFNVTWGILPTGDLLKYRSIVRSDPWVQASFDKQVMMALQQGYLWNAPANGKKRDEMIAEVNNMFRIVRHDFDTHFLPRVTHDMLVYGFADGEIVLNIKEDMETTPPNLRADRKTPIRDIFIDYEKSEKGDIKYSCDVEKAVTWNAQVVKDKREKKEPIYIVNIKALDPCYMRVRVNALGQIIGYLQWIAYPPVAFWPDKIVHFSWMPRTVQGEYPYGTSELMSLIRTESIIKAYENAFYSITWAAVRPPFIWEPDPNRPETFSLSDDQKTAIMAANATRRAGDDVFAFGMKVTQVNIPEGALNALKDIYNLAREDRAVGIKTPPSLLGVDAGGSSRANDSVKWDIFLVHLKNIQMTLNKSIVDGIVVPVLKKRGWSDDDIEDNRPFMDWEDVSSTDINMRSQRSLREFLANGITLNELREELGRSKVPGGDVFYYEIQAATKAAGGSTGDKDGPFSDKHMFDDVPSVGKGRMITDRDEDRKTKDDARKPATASVSGQGYGNLVNVGLSPPVLGPKRKARCPQCSHRFETGHDSKKATCPNCGYIVEMPTA